tara:strand:- start:84 stop:299 length:216 start_codon:yes stop_codon:yes gene_type:complete
MEYKNNTTSGIKVPVKSDDSPVSWLTFHPGDSKEVPEKASNAAELLGLDKVVVKAVKSSIGKTKVETKKKE